MRKLCQEEEGLSQENDICHGNRLDEARLMFECIKYRSLLTVRLKRPHILTNCQRLANGAYPTSKVRYSLGDFVETGDLT